MSGCCDNDDAANVSVFIAAAGVWLTDSYWPDVVVAMGRTMLLLRSGTGVIRSALGELHNAPD